MLLIGVAALQEAKLVCGSRRPEKLEKTMGASFVVAIEK